MTKPNIKFELGSQVDQIINQCSPLATSFIGLLTITHSWQLPYRKTPVKLRWGWPWVLTCRGGARLGAGALHLSAISVHTPAEVTLPVALQGGEAAQVIALGHILVIPGGATIVLQQVFSPTFTDGLGPLGGL